MFFFLSSCNRPLAVFKRRTGILMTELLSSQVARCGPVKVLNKAHSSKSTEPGLPLASLHTYFEAAAPRSRVILFKR